MNVPIARRALLQVALVLVSTAAFAAQPDLMARFAGETAWFGDEIIGTAGEQNTFAAVNAGDVGVYEVAIENEGAVRDSFQVRVKLEGEAWNVAFYDALGTGGNDITATATGAAPWIVGPIEPGAAAGFRIEITTPGDAIEKARTIVILRAASVGDADEKDALRVAVRARTGGGTPDDGRTVLDDEAALGAGSEQLETGEYVKVYQVDVERDDKVQITLDTEGFAGYLAADVPGGDMSQQTGGVGERVELDVTAVEAGELLIYVTTADVGAEGPYKVTAVRAGGAPGPGAAVPAPGPAPDPGDAANTLVDEDGTLGPDSAQLETGEWVEIYRVNVERDDEVRVSLDPDGFAAYLAVDPPGSDMVQQTGALGAPVQLDVSIAETGELVAYVTTADVGAQGSYHVTIARAGDAQPGTVPIAPGGLVVNDGSLLDEFGKLGLASDKLRSGEFYKLYTVAVDAGEAVTITLAPTGFAGYLVVDVPGGDREQEAGNKGEDVVLTVTPKADGDVEIYVTTSQAGEKGDFRITVRPASAAGPVPQPRRQPGTPQPGTLQPATPAPLPGNGEDPFDREGTDLAKMQSQVRAPAADPQTNTGLFGKTLYHMKRITVTISGKHYYEVLKQVEEKVDGEWETVDKDESEWREQAIGVDWYDTGLWPGSMYVPDDFTWTFPDLTWDGNIFRAYNEVHGVTGAFEVDVLGVISPDGNRLVQLYTWIMQQEIDPDPGTPGQGLLAHLHLIKVVLNDVPYQQDLGAYRGKFDTLRASFQEQTDNGTRPEACTYEYSVTGPDAGDRILELRDLRMDPSFCCPDYIPEDRQFTNEYRRTEWTGGDRPAVVSVRLVGE
ncbi:MAG TPA: hypothetical protein QGH10_13040 [Armatimonadota bacterium]|nr:hypothetical protein [Armatimonadota bacterium]